MFEIRVEADFSAAHFLENYHGKCENLHGHNYLVHAHARGSMLDGGGMLFDFGILKNTLRTICKELDHTNLNEMQVFDHNPSAERIAKYIFEEIKKHLPNVPLFAVDVFETPTSRARYSAD